MSTEIVSQHAFGWFLTALTGGLAGTWLIHDVIFLWRARNADRGDAVVRDKHFGYVIGMIIGVIGVLGCLKFQGVF